jgi:ferredoxin
MPTEDHDLALAAATGAAPETESPESLVVRLGGRKHSIEYRAGDTVLEALRRAGLNGPFNCQQGHCGTCIARLETGTATMRANNVLDDDEVEEGWILTCQAVPTSREVVVEYDQ